jgi:quercetin dioxygenase-like cupin family protein
MAAPALLAAKKSLNVPDQLKLLGGGRFEIVKLNQLVVGRVTLPPGWRWSKAVGPIIHKKSCQAHHLEYIVSGRMQVRLDDGTELDLGPGDVAVIPPGHDNWVVGDEPCVLVDFAGMKEYASKEY